VEMSDGSLKDIGKREKTFIIAMKNLADKDFAPWD